MFIEISNSSINYLINYLQLDIESSNNYVDKIRLLQKHKLLLKDATYKIINSDSTKNVPTDKFCGKFREKQTITTLQNKKSTVTIEKVI